MNRTAVITSRVVVILAVLGFFSLGCGLIDSIVRGLARYCETPEFVVDRTDDPPRGGICSGDSCSLRQALQTSNGCPGTQTIRVPSGTYLLSLVGTDEDGNLSGDLDITDSVIILGEDGTVIDGGGIDRVFDILSPAHATLTTLTITHGNWVDGGGVRNAGTLTMNGGAIQDNLGRRGAGLFNAGTAELDSVMIQDNRAERGSGGGIYNEGNLSLTNGALMTNTGSLSVQGGGLSNTGTAVLEGVNVEGNSVDLEGGGVYNAGTLTMSGGYVQKNGAGSAGAGLYNQSDSRLSLTGVTIVENQQGTLLDPFGLPASGGAGLANSGEADLDACLIAGNQAPGSRGGGILNDGSLTVLNTTLEGNTAVQGGGLLNLGTAFIDGSTINNNTATGLDVLAAIGGGIDNYYQASLTLTNSTLSQNVAVVSAGSWPLRGAGLYNEGVAELSSVTVTGNNPDGLYSGLPGIEGEPVGPPAAQLKNTIVAGNTDTDCSGTTILSLGNNLDGDNTCGLAGPGDLPGRDPRLDPLASNGGPTRTHALQNTSPARDQGGSCPTIDQRGFPRPMPAGGVCDIGAYEYDPGNSNTPAPTATSAAAAAPAFTFDQEANCRQGPNTLYPAMGFGQIGQQARIEGLSDPPGWYYVLLADGLTRCFVAGSTGTVTGPMGGLPVIPAPPLPVAPAAPVLNVSTKVCTSGENVVRLSWKDVEGEDGYRIYRDGTLVATLGADATSYDDTLPDYEPHEYRVEAYNAAGSTSSATLKSEGCVY